MSVFIYFGHVTTSDRCLSLVSKVPETDVFPQISKETFCWLFALIIFRILLGSNTCQQSLTGRKTRVKGISLSLFYFLRCSAEDWSINWLVRCQKMGTSSLKVLDMLFAACMWGRCDSGLWGIAELGGGRGPVTCCRLTLCVHREEGAVCMCL